jgi:hypothetical protein
MIVTRRSRIVAKHLDIFSETFGDEIYEIRRFQIILPPILRTISFVSVRKGRSGLDTKPFGESCEIALECLKSEKHIHLPRDSVDV